MQAITKGIFNLSRLLKYQSVVVKYTFLAIITFRKINSSVIQHLLDTFIKIKKTKQSEKDCHQDNLPFVCLQFCKHNCLNILASNICFHKRVKNQ